MNLKSIRTVIGAFLLLFLLPQYVIAASNSCGNFSGSYQWEYAPLGFGPLITVRAEITTQGTFGTVAIIPSECESGDTFETPEFKISYTPLDDLFSVGAFNEIPDQFEITYTVEGETYVETYNIDVAELCTIPSGPRAGEKVTLQETQDNPIYRFKPERSCGTSCEANSNRAKMLCIDYETWNYNWEEFSSDSCADAVCGKLTVNTFPDNIGAKWQVANFGPWMVDGEILMNIPIGDYTIKFNAVESYNTPSEMSYAVQLTDIDEGLLGYNGTDHVVEVEKNSKYTTASFSADEINIGMNSAESEPIFVTSEAEILEVSATCGGLGTVSVENVGNNTTSIVYSPKENKIGNDNILVRTSFQGNQLSKTIPVNISAEMGTVTVNIVDDNDVPIDGLEWQIDSLLSKAGGESIEIPSSEQWIGDRIVYLPQKFGYTKPENIVISKTQNIVEGGGNLVLTARYTKKATLDVDFSGTGGDLGRWKIRSVSDVWNFGSNTLELPSSGTYIVEFLPIEDWIAPDNKTITVEPGENLSIEAKYIPLNIDFRLDSVFNRDDIQFEYQEFKIAQADGTTCSLTDNMEQAQENAQYQLSCYIDWTTLPDGFSHEGKYIRGRYASEGNQTIAYSIHAVESDGSTNQVYNSTIHKTIAPHGFDFDLSTNGNSFELNKDDVVISVSSNSTRLAYLTYDEETAASSYDGSRTLNLYYSWDQIPAGLTLNEQNGNLEGKITNVDDNIATASVFLIKPSGERILLGSANKEVDLNIPNQLNIEVSRLDGLSSGNFTAPLEGGRVAAVNLTGSSDITLQVYDGENLVDEKKYHSYLGREINKTYLLEVSGKPLWETTHYRVIAKYDAHYGDFAEAVEEFDVVTVPYNNMSVELTTGDGDRYIDALHTDNLKLNVTMDCARIADYAFNPLVDGTWKIQLLKRGTRGDYEPYQEPFLLDTQNATVNIPLDDYVGEKITISANATVVSPFENIEHSCTANYISVNVKNANPPIASIKTRKTSGSIPFKTSLILDIDPEFRYQIGDILWEISDNDGSNWTELTEYSGRKSVYYKFDDAGRYLVRAKLTNSASGASSLTLPVDITTYDVPEVAIDGKAVGYVGEQIQLTAIAKIGETILTDEDCIVEWVKDKEVIGNSLTLSKVYNESFSSSIYARVRLKNSIDERGAWDEERLPILIYKYRPLRVSISNDSYELIGGETYAFNGTVDSPYSTLSLTDYNIGGEWVLPDGTTQVANFNNATEVIEYTPSASDIEARRINLELRSWIEGHKEETLNTSRKILRVFNGGPIVGELATNREFEEVPFRATLMFTPDNLYERALIGVTTWQKRLAGETEWQDVSTNSESSYRIYQSMDAPGEYEYRVIVENYKTGELFESNVEKIVAMEKFNFSVDGDLYGFVDQELEIKANVRNGENEIVSNGVFEWTDQDGNVLSNNSQLTLSYPNAGRYYITAKYRPANVDDWLFEKRVVQYVSQLKTLRTSYFVGKSFEVGYDYQVKINRIYPIDNQSVEVEWVFPDGSTCNERVCQYSPSAVDAENPDPKITISVWSSLDREATLNTYEIPVSVWKYRFPEFSLKASTTYEVAPSRARIELNLTDGSWGTMLDPVVEWVLPETASITRDFGSFIYVDIEEPGEHSISAKLTDARNGTAESSTVVSLRQEEPLTLSKKTYFSEESMKEPLSARITYTFNYDHPGDRYQEIRHYLDGEPIEDYEGRYYVYVKDLTRGEHTIKTDVTTRYGVTSSEETHFTVEPNVLPVCEYSSEPVTRYGKDYIRVTAQCSDEDGAIRGYGWFVDGKSVGSAFRNSKDFLISEYGGKIAECFAYDDSGASSSPHQIPIN